MGNIIYLRYNKLGGNINNMYFIQELAPDNPERDWLAKFYYWNDYSYKILFREKLQGVLDELKSCIVKCIDYIYECLNS